MEEKGSRGAVSRAYLVSMYIFIGLVVVGLAVSIGLFLSGTGEGLCITFPVVLLGAVVVLLHSVVTHNGRLLAISIVILALIALTWVVLLTT